MNIKVKSFYHKPTSTWSHLLVCNQTKEAVIIDPVLDYNPNSANTSTKFIDEILFYIDKNTLKLQFILETHAHADHLTAAEYIKNKTAAKTVIGFGIVSVQAVFKKVFNLNANFSEDGSQFDLLMKPNDTLKFGHCEIIAMHTPGHTEDSMSYIVDDCVFIGDTLFSPDYGSARCDFPGGSSEKLFDSIQKIYNLGENKKLYLCHDYPSESRQAVPMYLSIDQQQNNVHINVNTSKNDFVLIRNKRDKTLDQPQLIIPSIQVNICAGNFPKPEDNGHVYLKVPLNVMSKL